MSRGVLQNYRKNWQLKAIRRMPMDENKLEIKISRVPKHEIMYLMRVRISRVLTEREVKIVLPALLTWRQHPGRYRTAWWFCLCRTVRYLLPQILSAYCA